MKRFAIISMLMILNAIKGYSQVDASTGVHFIQAANWQAVLQQAKAENKFIFVDCYATWCGPCKWMDKNVYMNDSLGGYMNGKFLSVRLQMDSTGKDAEEVRNWYSTAAAFGKDYQIHAYPTYLIFSPDGQAVHKEVGSMKIPDFVAMTETALNPQKQYYTLLAHYRQNPGDYASIPSLAREARHLKEDSLSNVLAHDYVHHYLEPLPQDAIWTKDNIQFIGEYSKIIHFKDRIFRRYLQDRKIIDSVMGTATYADGLINYMAYNEDVKPKVDAGIKDSTEPNWQKLEKTVSKKYGPDYVAKNVCKGRVEYYGARKEWTSYATYFVKEMQAAGIQNWPAGGTTALILNNDAFEVFKHSSDKNELQQALSWVDRAMSMKSKPDANALDTKANILYKLGRKDEGITLEMQATQLDPKDKEIAAAYMKMKSGQPTWE